MEVIVEIPSEGQVTIKAIDLVGDAWYDYLYYMGEAHKAEAIKDTQAVNRTLRAALSCLISHLDGVVTGLCEDAQQSRNDFVAPKGKDGRNCSLKSDILYLKNYADKKVGMQLPFLRLHLKPMRDILVHPSIIKRHYDQNVGDYVELSQKDLFDLTVNELDKEGRHISKWLDRLCLAFNYTRLHDTEKVCAELSVSLGDASEIHRL